MEKITGYEVRKYYDGVDGNGSCVAQFDCSDYASRKSTYAAAKRHADYRTECGYSVGYSCSVFALYENETPAEARNGFADGAGGGLTTGWNGPASR